MIASLWKVFEKAGAPGWAALIPFYNLYVLVIEVARLEILWFILCFVPFVNIFAIFKIYIAVAEQFGKSAAFGIGLVFLGFIFFPMLAFGDAVHESQQRRRRRRRSGRRDYSDYDDDDEDRPRKKRRRDEDYEDEEDERPMSKRRYEDDEDDEDELPRKRRRRDEEDDDEEEERPRKRRRRVDDDY